MINRDDRYVAPVDRGWREAWMDGCWTDISPDSLYEQPAACLSCLLNEDWSFMLAQPPGGWWGFMNVCRERETLRLILQKSSGVLEAHPSGHAGSEDRTVTRGCFQGITGSQQNFQVDINRQDSCEISSQVAFATTPVPSPSILWPEHCTGPLKM